ncbi:MAG: hypothetical protein H6739_12830 [Alphaproteobacteria bacterium]|nr:hypothetical protein [Alphaproteobacteria bacterium]
MTRVDLVYDPDCPNVDKAREALREAIAALGGVPSWAEWRAGDPDAPARTRGYGSPTVLVGGQDVTGQGPGDPGTCRLEAPRVEQIIAALRRRAA